ncbi:MAG: hypothetical protein HON04_01165 [Planctomicrobium sp.]|nr:hypothetical protein [Planctomicrobium sp.]
MIGDNGMIVAPSLNMPECEDELITVRRPDGKEGSARRIETCGDITLLQSDTAIGVPVISLDDSPEVRDGDTISGLLNGTDSVVGKVVKSSATVVVSDIGIFRFSPPLRFYKVIRTSLKLDEATHSGAPLLTSDGKVAGMLFTSPVTTSAAMVVSFTEFFIESISKFLGN